MPCITINCYKCGSRHDVFFRAWCTNDENCVESCECHTHCYLDTIEDLRIKVDKLTDENYNIKKTLNKIKKIMNIESDSDSD